MRRQSFPRARVLLVAAAAIVAVGCGDSGDDSPANPAAGSSTRQATDRPPVPLPSPAELNAGLGIALNPATPADQKLTFVQGAENDPELIARVTEAATKNGVTMTVTQVEYTGGETMQARATLSVNGTPVEGQSVIPFVAENGRWKLQKAWACQMLANAQTTSPSCP
ncbi:hypothetical protein APR12_000293 [Nocardia amikacinitolerans]|uniref:hypothetical protein n=1 Tax=Nocardia amikacinitolerans TaxID=756689 RepID=UPI00082A3543|nr:hypothetical protein [Nocardia amikacinitolerans]MCP2314963.1 hypothetical protein [Nocardia amikacinitolerans]